MLKTLINKVPGLYIRPWLMDTEINKDALLKKLPEDIDIVERYVYDSDRFIYPRERTYCRLIVYYNSTGSIAEIESIAQIFKKGELVLLDFPLRWDISIPNWLPHRNRLEYGYISQFFLGV